MKTDEKSAKSLLSKRLERKKKGKVLIYDIETAGVQGLCADLGFVVCFGWKWSGDAKPKCITILDYPGKNCHDDSKLLAAALEIMEEADVTVAHYGDRFDRKFLESRIRKAGMTPLPNTRQADTCLLSRAKFKLSSNRLDNLARFLDVETRKMYKGDGWPNWWFGALRGDKKSILNMAKYCCVDVQCLDEIYEKMKPLIPNKYLLNMGIGVDRIVCVACGGRVQHRGTYFSEKKLFRRYQCVKCGKWGHEPKPLAKAL